MVRLAHGRICGEARLTDTLQIWLRNLLQKKTELWPVSRKLMPSATERSFPIVPDRTACWRHAVRLWISVTLLRN